MFDIKAITKAVNTDIGQIQTIDFENLTSPRGNIVPNQFSVFVGGSSGNFKAFKSYSSLIAVKINGVMFFDQSKWDYSPTTLKYLKQWLGYTVTKKELVKAINEGQILLADFN